MAQEPSVDTAVSRIQTSTSPQTSAMLRAGRKRAICMPMPAPHPSLNVAPTGTPGCSANRWRGTSSC